MASWPFPVTSSFSPAKMRTCQQITYGIMAIPSDLKPLGFHQRWHLSKQPSQGDAHDPTEHGKKKRPRSERQSCTCAVPIRKSKAPAIKRAPRNERRGVNKHQEKSVVCRIERGRQSRELSEQCDAEHCPQLDGTASMLRLERHSTCTGWLEKTWSAPSVLAWSS